MKDDTFLFVPQVKENFGLARPQSAGYLCQTLGAVLLLDSGVIDDFTGQIESLLTPSGD